MDFREINSNQNFQENTGFLDICILNNKPSLLFPILNEIHFFFTEEDYQYRITVIDFLGEFVKNCNISEFVEKYPRVKVFMTQDRTSEFTALHLYLKENKSPYLLILQSLVKLKKFNIQGVIKSFKKDSSVVALLPEYYLKEIKQPYYGLTPLNRLFQLKSIPAQDKKALFPLAWNLFVDRERFLSVISAPDFYFFNNFPYIEWGLRVWMRDFKLSVSSSFSLSHQNDFPFILTGIKEISFYQQFQFLLYRYGIISSTRHFFYQCLVWSIQNFSFRFLKNFIKCYFSRRSVLNFFPNGSKNVFQNFIKVDS